MLRHLRPTLVVFLFLVAVPLAAFPADAKAFEERVACFVAQHGTG